MLAGHQPPLAVAGVAIGVVGRKPVDADPDALDPAHHAIVRDVAPDQEVAVGEEAGPLGPLRAGVQLLEPAIAEQVALEAGIEVLEVGALEAALSQFLADSGGLCVGQPWTRSPRP
jgi:hypothetical protein